MALAACLSLLGCAIHGGVASERLTRELTRQAVSFETEDKVRIAAHWFPANAVNGPRPALILLHGGNRYKERWAEAGFLEFLASENYHYLAIDIRGRGDSGEGDADLLRLNPTLARFDVRAALAWVRKQPGVNGDRVALVGSSYGANLACAGCMGWGFDVKTVVCFSATAACHRFLLHATADEVGRIPAGLFLACDDEPARYAASETAEQLAADTDGESRVIIYPAALHALSIFEWLAESREEVRRWLRAHL